MVCPMRPFTEHFLVRKQAQQIGQMMSERRRFIRSGVAGPMAQMNISAVSIEPPESKTVNSSWVPPSNLNIFRRTKITWSLLSSWAPVQTEKNEHGRPFSLL